MNRTRPHTWKCNACVHCGMRAHWEGAKHGCEGVYAAHRQKELARRREYNRGWRERARVLREQQRQA